MKYVKFQVLIRHLSVEGVPRRCEWQGRGELGYKSYRGEGGGIVHTGVGEYW